jgi:hypothetical protein
MLVSMLVSAGLTGAYFQVGSFLICRGLEQHDEAESRRITGFRQPVRCWRGASAGGPGGQRAGRWLGARRATSRPGLDTVWCARVEVCLRRKPPGSPGRGCPAPAAFVPHVAHTASEAGSQPGSFSAMPSTLAFAAVSLLAVQSGCGCISLQLSRSVNVRAKPAANTGAIVAGGKAMIIHQYVSKAVQDDAQLAGERNRLLLEARRTPAMYRSASLLCSYSGSLRKRPIPRCSP